MASRSVAILLAATSLGLLPCAAFAQVADAPAPRAAPVPAAKLAPKARRARVGKTAKPSAGAAAGPMTSEETEAASLERRRKAFFATKPAEAAPDGDAPPAGITLGGSGGLTPGMGFKF